MVYFITPQSELIALNLIEALQRQGHVRSNFGSKVMAERVADFDVAPDGRIIFVQKSSVAIVSTDRGSLSFIVSVSTAARGNAVCGKS